MTKSLDDAITLANPAEVLAAVPHLLGFPPADSLVLITVHDMKYAPRFGLTVRIDLPGPDQHYQLADYLLNGPIRNHGAEAVVLVVVGERASHDPPPEPPGDGTAPPPRVQPRADAPPHRDMIGVLREILGGAGISVLHAAWAPEIVAGGTWLCYEEDECGGVIADPSMSPLAAAMAAAGSVTFNSREELQELVAPESSESLARRAARLDALSEDLEAERAAPVGVRHDLEAVSGAIRRTAEGSALTEDDLLRVLIALSDNRVRDVALGTALGESAPAAERLWLSLVRKAPPPELAEVASLLAFSAYLRGEGALASVALERIEATRPDHRLGNLLRQALDAGIPAAEMRVIAKDAAEDARLLIEEDGAW